MNQLTSKRKSTPHTRSGCSVCRTRKVRCGEQRPSCHNCLRSRWTCPGYSKPKATNEPSTALRANVSITTYHLPCSVPGSQEDRKALHYFAVSAAEHIGGYFSADFWTRSVLQRCQHDAPVRHAVVALSCVHREYVASSVQAAFEASEQAVTAYTRSMKALRRYLRKGIKPDVRVVLMCCAAFFCFELIRGEQGAALQHLHSGVRILHQWQTGCLAPVAALAQETGRPQLVDVFARMDIQATAFDDGVGLAARKSALDGICLEDKSGEASMYQEPGLGPVKYSLLLRRCFSFLVDRVPWRGKKLEDVPDGLCKTRNSLLDELKVWHEHLDTLKAGDSNGKLPLHLQRAIARSRLHSTMTVILIQHSLPFPEPRPSLDDRTDELLQRASEAMGIDGDQGPEDGRPARRHFCLHLGVVAPLFLLAIKTSRADVLTSCLSLLRRSKGRREGLYDADITARVVEFLMSQTDTVDDGRSLLDRMGDDAATRLQEAVESVVAGKLDSTRRVRGLCRLLVIVG